MLLMDIAVPRDIEAGVGDLENVYLYDIDDLQKIAAENLARRHADVEKAWRIVQADAAELAAWFTTAGLGALMRGFDERARQIGRLELQRLFAKGTLASLSEPKRREVAEGMRRAMNKLLAAPRKGLRRASKDGRWEEYAGVARDLFELDGRDGGETDDRGGTEPERTRRED
jgi:glutamyl-tRNA reductase